VIFLSDRTGSAQLYRVRDPAGGGAVAGWDGQVIASLNVNTHAAGTRVEVLTGQYQSAAVPRGPLEADQKP
jgi:hypothetical protein